MGQFRVRLFGSSVCARGDHWGPGVEGSTRAVVGNLRCEGGDGEGPSTAPGPCRQRGGYPRNGHPCGRRGPRRRNGGVPCAWRSGLGGRGATEKRRESVGSGRRRSTSARPPPLAPGGARAPCSPRRAHVCGPRGGRIRPVPATGEGGGTRRWRGGASVEGWRVGVCGVEAGVG